MVGIEEIKSKLQAFKKRYYIRKFTVGLLLFLIISALLFLLVNGLEYQLWMGTTARKMLFFTSVVSILALLYWLVISPLLFLLSLRKGLNDQEAANEIAESFPEIQDKLLNTLQLYELTKQDNELVLAAIDKKARGFKDLAFVKAVDFSQGKRYGYILAGVIIALGLVSFINPNLFKDSTERLVKFNQEFTPEAPFSFSINTNLNAFKGEDFVLNVQITGESVPEIVMLHFEDGGKVRLQKISPELFQYTFPKIQESIKFQLEGSGFYSNIYSISVNSRPNLIAMNILIQSPNYTGGERRQVSNSGNITVLEGSSVTWDVSTQSSDSLNFFLNKNKVPASRDAENSFIINQRVYDSQPYDIELYNEFGKNASELNYAIEVIKDQRPTISVEYFPDSTMYRFVTLAGSIVDDHGFTSLQMFYKKEGEETKSIPLELAAGVKKQSFYANWNVDTLNLKPGEKLEFYVSVKDNDAVNGYKVTRSQTFFLQIPGEGEIEKIIDEKSQTVENQIDKSLDEAENIGDRLKKIEEKLKAEQTFEWQERKELNDIIEDREELEKQIEELQKQHEDLQRTSSQFNKRSEQTERQNEQLQDLLNELLDEKTRELYEQLKKLLEDENANSDEVRQQLQDIQQNEKNLERELDRALELFKRLKMESALEQNLQKLDSLQARQKDLSEQDSSSDDESLQEQQEQIQKEFEEFREKMDEVEQMNQELKTPQPMQDFELEERQISRELREINELFEELNEGSENSGNQENQEGQQQEGQQQEGQQQEGQQQEGQQQEGQQQEGQQQEGQQQSGKRQQSSQQIQQKQNRASQRMQQLTKQLSNMQAGMQMEMMQANLDQLRDILDNLVKLSFNQEELMTEMRNVSQSDPRFLELSQAQLKLKDDAKVIQDSLLSLAKRVVQISSFITREVGSINENIDEALDFLKDRNRGRALSSQQFAMTSINNLALLLDDTMQQMQMAMSEAMGNPSQGQQQQKGLPDLQNMQQQLGQQISDLRESGKQGRELSEELARLAAEQEMIRRQLEMIRQAEEGRPGGGQGDDLQRAIDQMEQNEVDLVNKRLTQQLLNRQKNIETRLLEAEKAQREQELEEEREAESPSVFSREIPPQFEEYLKMKQKELELLKTIPAELNPFYKKEVNDYFRRISSDQENDR